MSRKLRRDARLVNHGSLYLFHPLTRNAKRWINSNVGDEAQFFGNALVIEPRYVSDIVCGMADDGITVGGLS